MSSGEVLGSADTVMPDASGLELDQVTVVLLFEGPRYAEYTPDEAKELANAHLTYTINLVSDGTCCMRARSSTTSPGRSSPAWA